MPQSSQALHTSGKPSTSSQEAAERNATPANGTPAPLSPPLPASDPLGVIKAMSEEEKIALFT
jgi:hypothetical protein